MKLNLTLTELIMIEVIFEEKVELLEELNISCERERELLKKIYSISPTPEKKFPNLTK